MTSSSDSILTMHSPPAEADSPAARDVADQHGEERTDTTAASTTFVVLRSDDNAGVCGLNGVCS